MVSGLRQCKASLPIGTGMFPHPPVNPLTVHYILINADGPKFAGRIRENVDKLLYDKEDMIYKQ